jgi:CheY-like chemotaxis protein
MMPVMNGSEVLEAMKNSPELSNVPVVLMSASPPQSWRTLPMAGFLSKPFGLEDLIEAVQRAAGPPSVR